MTITADYTETEHLSFSVDMLSWSLCLRKDGSCYLAHFIDNKASWYTRVVPAKC